MAENKPNPLMHPLALPVSASVVFVILTCCTLHAQTDSLTVNRKRLRNFTLAAGTGYGASLVGLHYLWYRNTGRQSFRFFNDIPEWKQTDKLGHFYSAFYSSYGVSQAMRWCNVPPKKSDIIGAVTGFLIVMPIEVFDGFSDAYGASGGDLVANAAGSVFFLGQRSLWKQIRLRPKVSFHLTPYADVRPEILGTNKISRLLKDYNGQTYWIAADLDKFFPFPKWLNLAVGYGAQGMVYGRDSENLANGYQPYRQYYLSLDLDPGAIRTSSKFVKTVVFIVSMIKLPAPTLELANNKVRFHAVYF